MATDNRRGIALVPDIKKEMEDLKKWAESEYNVRKMLSEFQKIRGLK